MSEKQTEMKRITQILLMTVVVIAFGCSSCKEPIEPSNNTFTITDEVIDGITYKKLEGIINENISLTSSDNWLLSGGVFVEEGHTLTILNGGTIYTDTDVTTFLSVMAKVFIEGSQDNPVVFTPLKDNPTYGDWGGIVVNGYIT